MICLYSFQCKSIFTGGQYLFDWIVTGIIKLNLNYKGFSIALNLHPLTLIVEKAFSCRNPCQSSFVSGATQTYVRLGLILHLCHKKEFYGLYEFPFAPAKSAF